jgi:hypothetical protein
MGGGHHWFLKINYPRSIRQQPVSVLDDDDDRTKLWRPKKVPVYKIPKTELEITSAIVEMSTKSVVFRDWLFLV